MSCPVIDELELQTKLVSTLTDYVTKHGRPPVSTSILFEPYHEYWGIYHADRLMTDHDSPGDYDVNNAEVGNISAPDLEYQSAEFGDFLRGIGERLTAHLGDSIRPAQFVIELDYEWVYSSRSR
jgi:hypothetical protein